MSHLLCWCCLTSPPSKPCSKNTSTLLMKRAAGAGHLSLAAGSALQC
jgi:hypothetical protein